MVAATIPYIVQFNDDDCEEITLVPTRSAQAIIGTTVMPNNAQF